MVSLSVGGDGEWVREGTESMMVCRVLAGCCIPVERGKEAAPERERLA